MRGNEKKRVEQLTMTEVINIPKSFFGKYTILIMVVMMCMIYLLKYEKADSDYLEQQKLLAESMTGTEYTDVLKDIGDDVTVKACSDKSIEYKAESTKTSHGPVGMKMLDDTSANVKVFGSDSESAQISDNMINELISVKEAVSPFGETSEGTLSLAFSGLKEQCTELCGWLAVENTDFSYPVMYRLGDSEYYLKRDIYGNEERHGTPFIDGNTNLKSSSNLLIFGHNMTSDKTVFNFLLNYKDEEFYNEHRIISFDTLYKSNIYEIIAVFQSEIFRQTDDVFKYYKYFNIEEHDDFIEYVNGIKQLSIYDTGIEAEFGDSLITLSTCDRSIENGRFVVVAKLIREND